jgi:hypothetical protein
MTFESVDVESGDDSPMLYAPVQGAAALRRELSHRALKFAAANNYLHEMTDSSVPSVVFGVDEAGAHGNFLPASHYEITCNPAWLKRLSKVHTSSKQRKLRADWRWRELDCANSSDALLMNIFCHPHVLSGVQTRLLLGVDADPERTFGFKPRTPLRNGNFDATEVDLKLGDVLIEAKLTEGDFQTCDRRLIERYRDMDEVFEVDDLPVVKGRHTGYQLIRGTLAAHALGGRFCVLCDARRRDLFEQWYQVLRAVRRADLRSRLSLLTWQELAMTLPPALRSFLETKYGI